MIRCQQLTVTGRAAAGVGDRVRTGGGRTRLLRTPHRSALQRNEHDTLTEEGHLLERVRERVHGDFTWQVHSEQKFPGSGTD